MLGSRLDAFHADDQDQRRMQRSDEACFDYQLMGSVF